MNDLTDYFRSILGGIPENSILIFDEDDIFSYQQIRECFPENEYHFVYVDSQLAFRLAYEKYRHKVIIAVSGKIFDCLPDIKQSISVKRIDLSTLLPRYNRDAIIGLEFNTLNKLFQLSPYEDLSYDNTLKFILEQIYNVDFDSFKESKSTLYICSRINFKVLS